MHWRRLRPHAGDAVVLTLAYPRPKDEFLGGLAEAVEAGVDTDWRERLDLEIGLDIGTAEVARGASISPDCRDRPATVTPTPRAGKGTIRTAVVLVDDMDLVADPGDALLITLGAFDTTPKGTSPQSGTGVPCSSEGRPRNRRSARR